MAELPPGFQRLQVDGAEVVVLDTLAGAFRDALRGRATLYDYASRHPDARALAGRGAVFAVPLPGSDQRVVVRRNRHGGTFAALTGDVFRPPTRAPRELATAERLIAAGVPTPRVVAYALYPVAVIFRRADVATLEVADSFDLSDAIVSPDATLRTQALAATQSLLARLATAHARHHDLNIKNVLLRRASGNGLEAVVLDVDRVTFDEAPAEQIHDRNATRLVRSARKWRDQFGAMISDAELAELARPGR